MDDADMKYLIDLTAKISAIKDHQRARDEKIVSLLRYKRASVAEIGFATGLTKARIYQIVESAN